MIKVMNPEVMSSLLKGQFSKKNDDLITIRGKDYNISNILEELFRTSTQLELLGDELAKLFNYEVLYES